ncbi:hypothetical protein [Novosphingobium terrae]|uniref:hypothetical protein n=1 Tax=Novosphingobium terrae TaxID=2726189 RepID=UPI0019817946|nr:hypothetical protein [Novosphingobium terrae]
MPAKAQLLSKDRIVHPLEDLRPLNKVAAAALTALGDSLSDDKVGEAVLVPHSIKVALKALKSNLGDDAANRLSVLNDFAGREGVIVKPKGLELQLAGGVMPLPDDFAPCLILDASGRVRETYSAMEAAGTLKRLPGFTADYSRLRVHLWSRPASREAMKDDDARHSVLHAAATLIASQGDDEEWLIVHPKERAGESHSVTEELRGLVSNHERLSFLHWGNHHGTNQYRHIRRVIVLGLWRQPDTAYSALHIASGGPLDLATDGEVMKAMKAGEHRHHLLQAICRASVRNGTDGGQCGECEAYVIDGLRDAPALLQETFPGASVTPWLPEGEPLPRGVSGATMAIEAELQATGGKVSKAAICARLGITGEALRKTIKAPEFVEWIDRNGLEVTTRAFALRQAA